jgi:hypothetical protein
MQYAEKPPVGAPAASNCAPIVKSVVVQPFDQAAPIEDSGRHAVATLRLGLS